MASKNINPEFDPLGDPEEIRKHIDSLLEKKEFIEHSQLLPYFKSQVLPVDFAGLVYPEVAAYRKQLEALDPESAKARRITREIKNYKLSNDQYLVLAIENIMKIADANKWGLCKYQEFIYLYNGSFWAVIDQEIFQKFLGQVAEIMGVPHFKAKVFHFREKLLRQFLATEYLLAPDAPVDSAYINLKNGTLEISVKGNKIRQFDRSDFLNYRLSFNYDPAAKAPIFRKFLDEVLPDKESQNLLAEYLGSMFLKNSSNVIKLEKALILFGEGANGKSVIFEIVNALLGKENISNYSLQSLTDSNGYFRAMIGNKLLNYASEINENLQANIFKQLASGEPVEARLPYGKPMIIKHYAKLIFNCNELPREVEHTKAFFRRFEIIPFNVVIPEEEQDKKLHLKIIEAELPGVLNWVLDGLGRLLTQNHFSSCEASRQAVDQFKTQTDSVKIFIEENGFLPDPTLYKLIKELYLAYRTFCLEDGYKPVNKTKFIKRLKNFGVVIEKKNVGNVAFMK